MSQSLPKILPLTTDLPILTDAQSCRTDEQDALRDYDTIRRSIEYLPHHWRDQPSLERLAGHVGCLRIICKECSRAGQVACLLKGLFRP